MFLLKRMDMHMQWNKDGERENKEVVVHPSDEDVWNALQCFDPEFAKDARNICIGTTTDGFPPFGENAPSYSCWPIFAISYNLPPICMKYKVMFLCLIIAGSNHPVPKLNVMVKPLIDGLKKL
jgi:hypothetical protein